MVPATVTIVPLANTLRMRLLPLSAMRKPPSGVGATAAGRKPRAHDTWIAATALVHGAQVWTQDADFTNFAAADVVRV